MAEDWKIQRSSCVYQATPKGKRAEGTYKQWQSTSNVVFEKFSFFPWISYSLLLKVTTVCNLWQKASSIFGSGSLNFLEMFSSQTAIIFQTCFVLSLSDASSLSFSEQNVVFSWDWAVMVFFKPGIESHMVMIWECEAWLFFFLSSTFLSGQWTHCRNIKGNVCCWIKVIFFLDHIIASCGVYD